MLWREKGKRDSGKTLTGERKGESFRRKEKEAATLRMCKKAVRETLFYKLT